MVEKDRGFTYNFDDLILMHISREFNTLSDSLSKEALALAQGFLQVNH